MFRGIPTTIEDIAFSRTIFCKLGRNASLLGIVSSGGASIPSSSEIATPMRLAPKSIPRRRILLKFFRQGCDQVFYPFNFMPVTHQNRILGLDYDQVMHAYQGQMKLLIRENNVVVRSLHRNTRVSRISVRQLLKIFGDGGPAAHVIPIKSSRLNHHPAGLFHDRVVHRDFGEPGETIFDYASRVATVANRRNKLAQSRGMPIQLGQDCFYGPDENAGIPIEVAAFHKRFRQIRSRFFPEAGNFEKVGDRTMNLLPPPKVAISGPAPNEV